MNTERDRFILVPRISVTGLYTLHFFLGVLVAIMGSPTLASWSPRWWIPFWGFAVIISSLICSIASLKPRWEAWERWAAVALISCFIAFPFSAILYLLQGELNRAVFFIVLVIAGYFPLVRLISLLRRTGIEND